jgi:hypothetical protein
MEFGSIIGSIGLLYLVGTSNYNIFTYSHILQFTTACIKPSVCFVFPLCLIATSNTLASSPFMITNSLAGDCLEADSVLRRVGEWM